MYIKGFIKKDKKTKELISRLKPGDIALISHRDLDEVAAISLVESKVKCIVNADKTISGRYNNQGPKVLLDAKIPIFELQNDKLFDKIKEGQFSKIINNKIIIDDKIIGFCSLLDENKIDKLLQIGYKNLEKELKNFIENTLEYAGREKDIILGNIDIPTTKVKMDNKHVLVVARGKDYKKDLSAVKNYIKEKKPILIGVDGGGDTLMEFGYIPDIIVGDMDSISDKCLKLTKEIIVHVYQNGKSPGLDRINNLGLKSTIVSIPGISEDIALLLAYSNNADLIVAIGTHSNMIDFLEKGRKGMSSTFLVRSKVGSKLIDAKGVNKLYKSSLKVNYILALSLAAVIPLIIVALKHPLIIEILQLIYMNLRLL